MKVFENSQKLKDKRRKSLKNKIDKMLVLYCALQYEEWFVDIQTKVIAFFGALILLASLYGALRFFAFIILALP